MAVAPIMRFAMTGKPRPSQPPGVPVETSRAWMRRSSSRQCTVRLLMRGGEYMQSYRPGKVLRAAATSRQEGGAPGGGAMGGGGLGGGGLGGGAMGGGGKSGGRCGAGGDGGVAGGLGGGD